MNSKMVIGLILVFFGLRIIVQSRRTVANEVTLPTVAAQRKRAGTFTAPFMVLFGLFQFFTGLSGWNPDFDPAAREYVLATSPYLEKYTSADEQLMRPIRKWLVQQPTDLEEFDAAYEKVQDRLVELRNGIESITVPETDKGIRWRDQVFDYLDFEEKCIASYHDYMSSRIATKTLDGSEEMKDAIFRLGQLDASRQEMALFVSKVANECAN